MSFEPGAPDNSIPLCVPQIGGNAWQYVRECLDTGWVSSVGKYVERFEQMMAQRVGVSHAVATVNGTAALHIALVVAGVQPGDEVLVSSLTFIASANAIRYAGAWPIPLDAEPRYWQLDAEHLARFLGGCRVQEGKLVNPRTGRRVAAIVPVHVLGHPVDMEPVLALSRQYGLPVVEDAAESLGAAYRGTSVGALGDIACFSFNGNKLITTGGGGMIVTRRNDWAERARYLTTQAKDDPLEYIHGALGYNYRLTNIQAALGCAQLEQLDAFCEKKRQIAARYHEGLSGIDGIVCMSQAPWASSAWWLYTVLVEPQRYGMNSRQLLRRLAQRGIQTRPLWQPMHLSPVHQASAIEPCPVATELNLRAISLPSSVGLSEQEQQRVIAAIGELAQGAPRTAAA